MFLYIIFVFFSKGKLINQSISHSHKKVKLRAGEVETFLRLTLSFFFGRRLFKKNRREMHNPQIPSREGGGCNNGRFLVWGFSFLAMWRDYKLRLFTYLRVFSQLKVFFYTTTPGRKNVDMLVLLCCFFLMGRWLLLLLLLFLLLLLSSNGWTTRDYEQRKISIEVNARERKERRYNKCDYVYS